MFVLLSSLVVLSSCLQYQLFQLNSLIKMGSSLVVMWKACSCASHVQVMFKSCSSHVQVMFKSWQFSHRLGDWKVFSLVWLVHIILPLIESGTLSHLLSQPFDKIMRYTFKHKYSQREKTKCRYVVWWRAQTASKPISCKNQISYDRKTLLGIEFTPIVKKCTWFSKICTV